MTLLPLGGLANRMRAILSAISLSDDTGTPLQIIWRTDPLLNCPFRQLFQPFAPEVALVDNNTASAVTFAPSRRLNGHIPGIVRRLRHIASMNDKDIIRLRTALHSASPAGADIPELVARQMRHFATGNNTFIASGLNFYPPKSHAYNDWFRPTPQLADSINDITSKFTPHTVAVHIRRTDNAQSIAQSPLQAFIDAMRNDIALRPHTDFFLATDDQGVKAQLNALFPGRITTSPTPANRHSPEGIRDALTEMYALSKAPYFHGSYYSAFSDIAMCLSKGKCDVVRVGADAHTANLPDMDENYFFVRDMTTV